MAGSAPDSGWLRATLEMTVLAALTEGDRHGYALAQRLGDEGFGTIRGGVLYPVLNRLETEAAVSSAWQAGEGGPGRKVYAITEAGRRRLDEQWQSWQRFTTTLDGFLRQTMEDR
ncbi:putative PadR-like family transcriptional regulator [Actinoplanes missouriensis 431]|uniref:Putative PadR-like family transcriptional regulator n=1 Tax=Actinoplanes missouriensis (strain ATCC 14538 / DSM 43046 / CBS 188.64 / JCM 3121 / NBRC 102363 / NCIMB 12654 / NRRL B-3342 / UNCC 431) TaxID=512565 RepID=I0HE48_ACTM4|nr:PadR family transcriptional regulator [Actinoplanes missouriensis]BAL91285.1 putative PadR-like family transcriptional regulator [Actinoplanes missouriensis 431]